MNYTQAKKLLEQHLKNKNLRKHCIAVGACMKKLAETLDEDKDKWELTGIIHDIDYEYTKDNPSEHGIKGLDILKEAGLENQEILNAVSRHPGYKDNLPQTKLDWALYSSDPLTGLIVAATLMHPDKKIESVDLGFLKRRFNEKRFAAGADRGQIKKCKELGLTLDKFLQICLDAMKEISDELGL